MIHIPDLSERQLQTVQCIFQGMTNEDISKTLGLKMRTVKAHKTRLFKKFNISNRYCRTVRLIHILSGGAA